MRDRLPRERQQLSDRYVEPRMPTLPRFRSDRRDGSRQAGNRAQAGELLDGLVSRAVLSKADAVVREHIERFQTTQRPKRIAGFM